MKHNENIYPHPLYDETEVRDSKEQPVSEREIHERAEDELKTEY